MKKFNWLIVLILIFSCKNQVNVDQSEEVDVELIPYNISYSFQQFYRDSVILRLVGDFANGKGKFLKVSVSDEKNNKKYINGIFRSDSIDFEIVFKKSDPTTEISVMIMDTMAQKPAISYYDRVGVRNDGLDSAKNIMETNESNVIQVPVIASFYGDPFSSIYVKNNLSVESDIRYFNLSTNKYFLVAKASKSDIFFSRDYNFRWCGAVCAVYFLREMTCADSLLETVKP